MKRLTPQEFLNKCYPNGLPIANFQWQEDMPEIMERYDEHLEETAWITDGSLPPADENAPHTSIEVVAVDKDGTQRAAFYHIEDGHWVSSIHPIAWRLFPTPPKQP